jgi:mannose-6-phosphate isomerase-like protein (cupin superfamily)
MAKNAQNFEERPWGTFTVIHEEMVSNEGAKEDVIIKKLVVAPGGRLSYQSHKLREETWCIVQGKGVAIMDDAEIQLVSGSVVHVPVGVKHRISNMHTNLDLILIEVGRGYFDEFDIERYDDDFGRSHGPGK